MDRRTSDGSKGKNKGSLRTRAHESTTRPGRCRQCASSLQDLGAHRLGDVAQRIQRGNRSPNDGGIRGHGSGWLAVRVNITSTDMTPVKRPKLLLLVWSFPPAPAIGSVRTWNIAKHMARLGWEV